MPARPPATPPAPPPTATPVITPVLPAPRPRPRRALKQRHQGPPIPAHGAPPACAPDRTARSSSALAPDGSTRGHVEQEEAARKQPGSGAEGEALRDGEAEHDEVEARRGQAGHGHRPAVWFTGGGGRLDGEAEHDEVEARCRYVGKQWPPARSTG